MFKIYGTWCQFCRATILKFHTTIKTLSKGKIKENSCPESKEKEGRKGTQLQQILLDLYVIFTIKSKIGTWVELFRTQQHSRKFSWSGKRKEGNIERKEGKGGREREGKQSSQGDIQTI